MTLKTKTRVFTIESKSILSSDFVENLSTQNRHEANVTVGETNNGENLVGINLKAVGTASIPFKAVTLQRGRQ